MQLRSLTLLATVAASAGCGLISNDVLDFPLDIKPRTFEIDAGSYMVNQTAFDAYSHTSCAATPSVCNSAAQQACTSGCSGTCGASNTCELQLQIGLYTMVDLQMDQSELASIDKTKGISVVIDTATYAVSENTLSVATPPMTIYVAPVTAMTPADPMAKGVGTVDSIPAMTTEPETAVTYTATGKADLQGAMTNFSAPFNLIVGGTVTLGAGATVPTGKLTATVKVNAHAHAL